MQSLYVKSDRIIIYSIGDDPTIVVDAEKEPGMTNITLQGVQIDPRFKLFQNSDQTEPSIGFVQVNAIAPSNPEDMTTASVEISIKTDHKNWQLIPRQGGFLLSKLDSPVNSDISSTISEQTSTEATEASLPVSETVPNPDSLVSQEVPPRSADQNISLAKNNLNPSEKLPEDHQPQILAEKTNPGTPSSLQPDEVQSQTNPENITPPEVKLETSEPQNTNISLSINKEEKTAEISSIALPPLTPLQLPPTQLINLETANVLPQGSILTTYGAHIFSKGQYGGGTGLQTYNISIQGGVTDELQLGLDWVLFDDTLG